jgi:hypothetical protein
LTSVFAAKTKQFVKHIRSDVEKVLPINQRFRIHPMTIFQIAALATVLAVPAARSDSLQVNSGLGGMVDQYLTRIAEHQWSDRTAAIEALRTPADVAKRQRYIHAKILEALGGFPEARTALNAHITGSLDCNGYRVEKLIYESLPHYYVTAHL